jgi:glycosyltransferase involved in cell wall biosynthesis
MTEDIEFSIIMPALNEEKNIELALLNSLDALDHFDIRGELIAINDGSTDQTEILIKSFLARDPRIRLISHDKPKGVGASFWDGEDVALEIFRYHALLNSVDIVIPFVFNKHVRSAYRNALSWIYRFIINMTFLVNFNYTNGTVMYRKALLDELEFRSSSFFFQTDILVRTVKRSYLFAEVPYRMWMRTQGISKAISFPSLFQVIRGYLRLIRDIYGPTPKNAPRSHVSSSQTAKRYQECESLERTASNSKP